MNQGFASAKLEVTPSRRSTFVPNKGTRLVKRKAASDYPIGPQRPAEPKLLLAEDFSVLILRKPRVRRCRSRVNLLH